LWKNLSSETYPPGRLIKPKPSTKMVFEPYVGKDSAKRKQIMNSKQIRQSLDSFLTNYRVNQGPPFAYIIYTFHPISKNQNYNNSFLSQLEPAIIKNSIQLRLISG
jgi:hypothetical protein